MNLIGQSIGRYHIIEQIGEGGMATVYKAYDTHLDRNVAIKIIRKEIFGQAVLERVVQRFEREGKALAKLSNAHIVHVYDFGEFEGSPYLVMEYVEAGTLKSMMGNPFAWQDAIKIIIPVAKALGYAHQRGIIHRDVKPSNILINSEGEPLLTDFGIAKLLEGEDGNTLTGAGVGIGTPEYMAPEQGVGAKDVDNRADIYSLGVVLYELLTGQKPYTAETPMAVVIMQARDPLPDPHQYVPDLPDAVANILFKALAKNPEDRFKNAAEFSSALENLAKTSINNAESIHSNTVTPVESNPTGTVILPESSTAIDEAVIEAKVATQVSGEQLISSETLETTDDLANNPPSPVAATQNTFDAVINPPSETQATFDDLTSSNSTHSSQPLISLPQSETKETIDDLTPASVLRSDRSDNSSVPIPPVNAKPDQSIPLPPVPPMPSVVTPSAKKNTRKWIWIPIGIVAAIAIIFIINGLSYRPAATAPVYNSQDSAAQAGNNNAAAINSGCTPDSIYAGDIFTGQTYTGQTTNYAGDCFSFTAYSGETITITMIGDGGYDTYLDFYDPNYSSVAADDDGAGYPNAQITYTALTSGIYTIIAHGYNGATGLYYLTVEEGNTSSAASSGAATTSNDQPQYYYSINAVDGWTNTGLYITSGQSLEITYVSGAWSACSAADCGGYLDANGSSTIGGGSANSLMYPDNIISGCYHGALIARIGDGEPFCINNSFYDYIYSDGELLLSINDAVTSDDSGEISIGISIH